MLMFNLWLAIWSVWSFTLENETSLNDQYPDWADRYNFFF
jgi:hypothetical protein